jgi:polar amino acid transport system ATP-binding protein
MLVRTYGVSKAFGERIVLHEVDFELTPGEIVVVMGASGGGKSTFLRLIAGLTLPDSGSIEIDGTTVVDGNKQLPAWREKRHLIGMVFQQYTLWPHMDVYANLALAPRKMTSESTSMIKRRAEKVLESVGMLHHLHSRPAQLSGGERQRAAIARSLMMRPQIILCDEITSALDPPVAHEVLEVLSTLKREDGIACLVVTHDVAFASKAADRVVFFENGQIGEQGPPNVTLRHPTSSGLQAFVEAVMPKADDVAKADVASE